MTASFQELPELQQWEAGAGLVRIPVELDVPFTPRVRAVVDTPQFQRLRHITQLGFASTVYPGATHTRFEHTLGVFGNALRYLRQLGKDHRFAEIMDWHSAEVLLVAALLHDIGHWPFCHQIEDMDLHGLPSHEDFAAEYLRPGSELAAVIQSEWRVEPNEVMTVLRGAGETVQQRLVQSILSGPIDIDKMDYLDRDSLHCGVPYGRNFDRGRLLQSLVLNESGDGLAIDAKGRTAAELMVFARYVMFSEVYWHHAVRSATAMFARCFFELKDRLDLPQLFRTSEADFIATIRGTAKGTTSERITDGLFGTNRGLYKRAAEFSVFQSPETYRKLARQPYSDLQKVANRLAATVSSEWDEEVAGTEILIDAPPPHCEVQFKVPIHYPKESTYRSLDEVSPVVASLAREQFDDYVKRVRVFVHPRFVGRGDDIAEVLSRLV